MRDVEARQRNIVFPDTAANEGRFWRNLYSGKQKLTKVQAVGLGVMAIAVAALVVFTFGRNEPYTSWGQGILNTALDWTFAFAVLGGFLLLLKWGTRQK